METSVTYTGKVAYFSSDEPKWRKRILKLAEEYPDEVHIIARPETNDGCVYATIPSSYVKIAPKNRRQMTDEQRAAAAERLRKYREENTQDK